MLLPPALGFSPHPPVSVYGTGTWYTIAAFLGSRNRTLPYLCSVRVTDSDHETDLPVPLLPCLPGALFPGCAVLLRPHSSDTMRYRNLDLLSIGYALKPRLRAPTYPGQISFTLETLDIRPGGFPPPSRYSFRHSLFLKVHSSLPVLLRSFKNAPLPMTISHSRASVTCFSPGHFRRRTSRLVSYYALFECVAASEPTS